MCPSNDEDRGSVRAGKRTERWCRARGKLGEEGLSFWTRHTRTVRGQARKLFGIENARSCGNLDRDRWGAEKNLGRGKSLDDDHGRATLGTKPKRARLLSSGDGGFDLRLRHRAE